MRETAQLVATMGNPKAAIAVFRDYVGLSDPTMEIDIRGAVTKVNEVMTDIEMGRLKFLFEPSKDQIKEANIRDFKKASKKK